MPATNCTFVDANKKSCKVEKDAETDSTSKVKISAPPPAQAPAFSEASSSKKHAVECTGVKDTFENIKRMRVVECVKKERTHTFWDGDALVVIELSGEVVSSAAVE
eukprot:6029900-Prymnesium_polylepis.1